MSQRMPMGLMTDYMRVDPVTGKVWVDAVGYTLEQLRLTPERSSEAARQIAERVPRSVRPLDGLQPNQLGQSVLFRPGEVLIPRSVFRVAPKGDVAELLTVALGVEPAEGAVPDSEDAFFQATLHWGMGGASYSAVVDVGHGTQLAVCASFLEVSVVRLPPGAPDPDDGPAASWKVSASAGFSGRANASQMTDRLGVLPTMSGAQSKIPPFATSFTLAGKNEAGAPLNVLVRVRRDLTDATEEQTYGYDATTNLGWNNDTSFPLGGQARFVDVFNPTVNDEYVEVIYALAL